jgi:hypothetical protein
MSIGIVEVCDHQLRRRRSGLPRTVIAETHVVGAVLGHSIAGNNYVSEAI